MLKGLLAILMCCGLLTAQETGREKLLTMLSGEWVARGLYVAAKLEVAEYLEEPKSAEELAKLTAANSESLARILHTLAGFGVFEEIAPGVFTNNEASRLLMKENADTLHGLTLFYGEEIHKSWDELLASIQTGTPAFELKFKTPVFNFFKTHPEQAALFQQAMKEKSKAVIQSALASYDFGKFSTLCDVGGGYGQFLALLLQKYPHLAVINFDLPEVIAKIEHKHGRQISGDFFESVPAGQDAYILKSVIHDWDDAKAEKILRNCHQAMRAESKLLIVEVVLLPKDESLYANCMDTLMLAITGGKERRLDSFVQMLDKSGFILEKIYPTDTEFSILEVIKKK